MGTEKSIESYIGEHTNVMIHFSYKIRNKGDVSIWYKPPEIKINAVWLSSGDNILQELNAGCINRFRAACLGAIVAELKVEK